MNYFTTLFVFIAAFLGVFAEAWFGVFRDIAGVQIDILPVLIVYTSLTSGIYTTALLAVFGGLWFDSLSCNPLGVTILPLFLAGLVIHECRDLLLRENSFAQVILGAAACVVCPAVTLFLILNLGHNPLVGWLSLWQFAVMMIGGAMMTPLCFRFFDWVNGALNYQPVVETTFRSDRQIKRGRH